MDLNRLAKRAKQIVDDRGGTEALKSDLQELKDIAKGDGTASDKAKRAADALKQPGAKAPANGDKHAPADSAAPAPGEGTPAAGGNAAPPPAGT